MWYKKKNKTNVRHRVPIFFRKEKEWKERIVDGDESRFVYQELFLLLLLILCSLPPSPPTTFPFLLLPLPPSSCICFVRELYTYPIGVYSCGGGGGGGHHSSQHHDCDGFP